MSWGIGEYAKAKSLDLFAGRMPGALRMHLAWLLQNAKWHVA